MEKKTMQIAIFTAYYLFEWAKDGNCIIFYWDHIGAVTFAQCYFFNISLDGHWNWSKVVEGTGMICFSELPFQNLTDYDIENNFISNKRKFTYMFNNDKFPTFTKRMNINCTNDQCNCECFDEGDFIAKTWTLMSFLMPSCRCLKICEY